MRIRQNGSTIRIDCPAKLNLYLDILSRRSDGYHELETLMVPITIFDTLIFSANRSGRIQLRCRHGHGRDSAMTVSAGDLPHGMDNIVLKAAEQMRQGADSSAGLLVTLVKRIPSAAGLGGASSDAAATLMATNRLWSRGLDESQLADEAARLGSDVPFFLGSGAAVCRGRGENITRLGTIPRLHMVVVKPPVGLSTPTVFQRCTPTGGMGKLPALLAAAEQSNVSRFTGLFCNQLQPAADQLSPWIARLRNAFDQTDVLAHQMTGSGSSYFGVCRHASHARRVANQIRSARLGTVYATTTMTKHYRNN